MEDIKIGIIGAAGRMGRAIIRQVTETDGCIVIAACDKRETNLLGSDVGELAGVASSGVRLIDDASSVVSSADVIIEFTLPDATIENAKLTAAAAVPHIIGTTGLLSRQLDLLKQAADKTVIMHAPNMSLLVNLLFALTKQVAETLGDEFDIEIFEMHHKHKVDAPSGTALRIGEAAADGRGVELENVAEWTRHGITGEREKGSIGFATLRGGNVVGDHSAIFAVEDERLVLSHKAQSRQIFARGAVHAALWARNQKPGYYNMFDVLGIKY